MFTWLTRQRVPARIPLAGGNSVRRSPIAADFSPPGEAFFRRTPLEMLPSATEGDSAIGS